MKKILLLLICIIFLFCGCNNETKSVTINYPTYDKVNGYRNNENVLWDDVEVTDKIPSIKSDANDNENNSEIKYCGNKNSKKFHTSSCSALTKTKDENKVYYNTKEEFIDNGFSGCAICNP